jgi:hypothetical protein
VTVPVLESPVFAAAERLTTPAPKPEAPETTVIHGVVVDAVQAHPAGAATLKVMEPPPAGTEAVDGDSVNEQPGAACEIVYVWPATVIVPVCAVPVFGPTVNATEPEPDPDWPDVIWIQDALAVAVHTQPALVVTAKVPLPPDAM